LAARTPSNGILYFFSQGRFATALTKEFELFELCLFITNETKPLLQMNPIVRNILAVVAGVLLGSVVNMGLIQISGSVIPPPAGADMTTAEGIKAALPLLEPKHFIFPFLAHALGTLVGAFIAAKIGATRRLMLAMIVGVVFLAGGIAATFMIPAPTWFMVLDVVVAYLPMAYLGAMIAGTQLDKRNADAAE